MGLTVEQQRMEVVYANVIRLTKVRVKKTGEIVMIKLFGSMVCWDMNGKWYSFYNIQIIG